MPRTNIPITEVAAGALVTPPAGTAVDQANGMEFNAGGVTDRLMIVIANTAGSAKNIIIRAGALPPAFRQGLGDLTHQITNGVTRWIGPLESARFNQVDGKVNVDFESGFTGTVTVVRLGTP